MLKYYIPTTEVCINSITPFHINLYAAKICENHPNTDIIKVNWDNAEEEIQKLDIWLPFGITKKRKGLQLFFHDYLFKNVKQWKEDLDIEIKTSWREYKPSLKEIMNFKDSDKAIQYLVERGFNQSSLME
jgi:hypothetical protein